MTNKIADIDPWIVSRIWIKWLVSLLILKPEEELHIWYGP